MGDGGEGATWMCVRLRGFVSLHHCVHLGLLVVDVVVNGGGCRVHDVGHVDLWV